MIWKAPEQARELNRLINAPGATPHTDEHTSDKSILDDNRLLIQHDRDRIVWSPEFKRLAFKTQVLPHVYGDHHRTRLTHSLEVMQLSTSIARALGLNPLLCEAIALAHDLGHTPFGHAGEFALDLALSSIRFAEEDDKELRNPIECPGLMRFTHYEHGLDIVSYIASRDPAREEKCGLDLQRDTIEGILKHTYDHSGPDTKHKSLSFLLRHTKYKNQVGPGPGTVEAQTVRICDKMCYLISDIEDGLLIGALHIDDLLDHEILSKQMNPAIDRLKQIRKLGASENKIFYLSRNRILTDVVESVVGHSASKMQSPVGSAPSEIVIEAEPSVGQQMKKLYDGLQKKIFFKHHSVQRANNRAHHIVSCLFCEYLRNPELVPWDFRSRYLRDEDVVGKKIKALYGLDHRHLTGRSYVGLNDWFEKRRKPPDDIVPCECISDDRNTRFTRKCGDVICAKDYVAGMTDGFAESMYHKVVTCRSSLETWNRELWDRLGRSLW